MLKYKESSSTPKEEATWILSRIRIITIGLRMFVSCQCSDNYYPISNTLITIVDYQIIDWQILRSIFNGHRISIFVALYLRLLAAVNFHDLKGKRNARPPHRDSPYSASWMCVCALGTCALCQKYRGKSIAYSCICEHARASLTMRFQSFLFLQNILE